MEPRETFQQLLETARQAVEDAELFQERVAAFLAGSRPKGRAEELDEWGDLTEEASLLLTSVSSAKRQLGMMEFKQLPVAARRAKQTLSTKLNDLTSALKAVIVPRPEWYGKPKLSLVELIDLAIRELQQSPGDGSHAPPLPVEG